MRLKIPRSEWKQQEHTNIASYSSVVTRTMVSSVFSHVLPVLYQVLNKQVQVQVPVLS